MSDELAVTEDANVLVLPTGVLIDLTDPVQVALGLRDIDALASRVREARGMLNEAAAAEADRQGRRTFDAGGYRVEVTTPTDTTWEIERLRDELAAAGLPEERLNQLIRQTVEENVDGNVARQLESSEVYRPIIERNRTRVKGVPKAKAV